MYYLKISAGQKFGSCWPGRVPYKVAIKVLVRDAVLWRLEWGWRVHVQARSHGCWLKTLGLHYTGLSWRGIWLSIEQVMWKAEGEREREGEREKYGNCNVFHDLILEVAYHFFCRILGHTGELWYAMRENYTNAWIPGDGDHRRPSWRLVNAMNQEGKIGSC